MNIIFFGSFQHYSAYILKSLIASSSSGLVVSSVVTTPPQPVGRKQIITKTPVHLLAEQHNLPVFTPQTLEAEGPMLDERAQPDAFRQSSTLGSMAEDSMKKPDLFLTAGYGKILPKSWLNYPKHGCLNLHFSLLPKYRGANPSEWAIMCGEAETGITLMEMNEGLDTGDIIQQATIPIESGDTRETLYEKLYRLGATHLPQWLNDAQNFAERSPARIATQSVAGGRTPHTHTEQQTISPTPYAALLKRQDGFLPWSTIQKFIKNESLSLDDFPSKHLQKALSYYMSRDDGLLSERTEPDAFRQSSTRDSKPSIETFLNNLPRALAGYPSLWTIIQTSRGEKRMKILSFTRATHASPLQIDRVQIEGQSPSAFNQIKNQISVIK